MLRKRSTFPARKGSHNLNTLKQPTFLMCYNKIIYIEVLDALFIGRSFIVPEYSKHFPPFKKLDVSCSLQIYQKNAKGIRKFSLHNKIRQGGFFMRHPVDKLSMHNFI